MSKILSEYPENQQNKMQMYVRFHPLLSCKLVHRDKQLVKVILQLGAIKLRWPYFQSPKLGPLSVLQVHACAHVWAYAHTINALSTRTERNFYQIYTCKCKNFSQRTSASQVGDRLSYTVMCPVCFRSLQFTLCTISWLHLVAIRELKR